MKNLLKYFIILLVLIVAASQEAIAGDGTSCSNPAIAIIGANAGNGNPIQYFSFTPATDEYLTLTTEFNNYSYAYIYTGDCNTQSYYNYFSISQTPTQYVQVKANTTYTLRCNDLNSNTLTLKYSDLPKEFSYFNITINSDYTSADVDTVANTLTFTVPADLDLTNLQYGCSTTYSHDTGLSANGKVILGYGFEDFSKINDIVITDGNGKTATYTVIINKKQGLSCGTAKIATEGVNTGENLQVQYFSYTATTSDYIQISTPSNNWASLYIYQNTCTNYDYENISSANPLVLKVDAGTTYFLRLNSSYDKSISIKKIAEVEKKFISFSISNTPYNINYYAQIDSVTKTLNFNIPTEFDLSNARVNYQTTKEKYISVTGNGTILTSYNYIDFTKIDTIVISDIIGNETSYKVVINKISGLTCGSATIIGEGIITGKSNTNQYFSFTPAKTDYIKISSYKESWSYITIFKNNCGWSNELSSGTISTNSPQTFLAEKGITYIMESKYLENKSFQIQAITDIPKEFSKFEIGVGGKLYSAQIDTIFNTLSFTIPTDLDLNKLSYSWSQIGQFQSTVTVDDKPIASNSLINNSTIALGVTSKIKITDFNLKSQIYTVFINKAEGLNCSTATVAHEGANKGNGYNDQYFSFKPQKTGTISISSPNNWIDATVYIGNCGALTLINDSRFSYSKLLPVNADTNYIINSKNQQYNDLEIKYIEEIPKEFTDFTLYVNNNYYSANINTVANTLTFNVPSNINLVNARVSYSLSESEYTSVALNKGAFLNNSYYDLSSASQLEIIDIYNNIAAYTIKINKFEGLNCSTAIIAKEGTTEGSSNGNFNTVYFTFTPTQTGFVNMSPTVNVAEIEVNRGNCHSQATLADGIATKDSPLLVYVKADSTYNIIFNSQENNSLNINYTTEIEKNFTKFEIKTRSNQNYYNNYNSVTINATAKTITFIVASDLDLTNLEYEYSISNKLYTNVIYNGEEITPAGTLDFTKSNEITITDANGKSITYTLIFVKLAGLSCGTAIEVKEGTTKSNGSNLQYLTYTAIKSGYVSISNSSYNPNITITSGDCNIGEMVEGEYNFQTGEFLLKATAGNTYHIEYYGVSEGDITIKQVTEIPKEFISFYINTNYDTYQAYIDTVANKLTITVPADFDGTNLNCSFSKTSGSFTKVLVNGIELANWNTNSINITDTISIIDTELLKENYTIDLKRVQGISCGSALVVNEGTTKGTDQYSQFFSFTPTKEAYYSVFTSNLNATVEIYSGDCGNQKLLATNYSNYTNTTNPIMVLARAGEKITTKCWNLNNGKLTIQALASLPKEFTKFSITSQSKFEFEYDTKIDTVANTITLNLPTDFDLSHAYCTFAKTGGVYTQARTKESILTTNSMIDLARTDTITIIDAIGATQIYKIYINKVEGLSCSTAREIKEGVTVGNGNNIQFVSFTPTKTGIINLSTELDSWMMADIKMGDCGSLTDLFTYYAYNNNPIALQVIAGRRYIMLITGLYNRNLNVEYTNEVKKEFTHFSLRSNIGSWNNYETFSSKIDTVANTITIGIPEALNQLSNPLSYNYQITNEGCNRVTQNGILRSNYGTYNFGDSCTLIITDPNQETATYKVYFKQVIGTRCFESQIATEGVNKGNGFSAQYFKFTPTKTGYVNLSASTEMVDITISKGACQGLQQIAQGNKATVLYAEMGTTYTIKVDELYGNNLLINYANKINKEFNYYVIGSNLPNSKDVKYFSAQIDTAKNTLSFAVTEDFDLSHVNSYYKTTCEAYSTVSADGIVFSENDKIDFNNTKELVITDVNSDVAVYTVNFYRIAEVQIKEFTIPGQISSTINLATQRIDVLMPNGTNIYKLTPTFTIPTGATAKIGSIKQLSTVTANNYRYAVTYIITGKDGVKMLEWKVYVSNGGTPLETMNADNETIEVYPNPSADLFHVKVKGEEEKSLELHLYTTTGTQILTQKIEKGDNQNRDIDLSNRPSGIYILQAITDEGKSFTIKLIKK